MLREPLGESNCEVGPDSGARVENLTFRCTSRQVSGSCNRRMRRTFAEQSLCNSAATLARHPPMSPTRRQRSPKLVTSRQECHCTCRSLPCDKARSDGEPWEESNCIVSSENRARHSPWQCRPGQHAATLAAVDAHCGLEVRRT